MSEAKRSLVRLAVLGACALATGCVPTLVRNGPMEAAPETPAHYPGAASEGKDAAEPALGARDWADVFPSPALRKLVDAALAHNQELNIQIQELVIARNEVAARRGEYQPRVGVGAEAQGLPENLGDFRFGLVASWEVDIWGKLRNAADAAENRYLASVEGRNFLVTQVVAELARSYYDLLALDDKLDVLRRNIALQARALEMIRVEKQAARVTELAVQRFEAEVAKNKSVQYDLAQERVQVENRINFLVGRYPQKVERHASELGAPLPRALGTGLPSALLGNRPDVRRAERALAAAKLDVAAARAAFFPALAIDARAGFNAFNPAHLLAVPESMLYGLAGNLTAPLLNRAAIEAQYGSANAKQVQAVIGYERTVLQAYTEVANQLANVGNVQKSYEVRTLQVAKLSKSVEMANLLFKAARADYVEVLLTRRDLLEAEMELIERRKARQQAVVNLYQALGGGWRKAGGP